ncbi:hypothetical protein [Psychroserpens luteolus]|uniref:hypothetical protein n=1 Tax=Psychroserpens luteolus TaxID=2855840 RepID=UPI001E2D2A1F|nr:hypothetical protein [Psychroserpens luteolus]MCD2259122.1 hypothetical protein [Psychroserpens luteolus]
MKKFYNILKKMEFRPAMWTGETSLKSIRIFLNGYSIALREHNILQSSEELEINFHDWIANKLGFYESTSGWPNMILAVTIGLNPKSIKWENYDSKVTKEQHEKSIKKFYELLEEFMNE